jgi:hypothetical protein
MAADAAPGTAAIRPASRAEAAMAAVIRNALARAGVDAASAPRLCFADATAPPMAIPDTAESQRRDANAAGRCPISPTHPLPNCSPGRSPSRRRNNPAFCETVPQYRLRTEPCSGRLPYALSQVSKRSLRRSARASGSRRMAAAEGSNAVALPPGEPGDGVADGLHSQPIQPE